LADGQPGQKITWPDGLSGLSEIISIGPESDIQWHIVITSSQVRANQSEILTPSDCRQGEDDPDRLIWLVTRH
jgi:hypothetical protein